ncbi:hypothetical protein AB0G71_01850 [Streptomyces sp. NPDC020403]|uniref:hypothetical protein n=1 Tax=unclassified Streptomyces TaxID=2593676 RepID=UPI0033E8051F
MKRERSSEESESGNGRSGASGGTAPDSSQGAVPGSIGAPSAPGPRTETEGGDAAVGGGTVGGLARTPTSSASGPEETGESEAQAPVVAHVAGISIGRTPSGREGHPGGEEAAVSPEAAAPVAGTASAATTTVAVAPAGAAGVGPTASVGGGAEGTAGTSTSPSAASEETASAEAGRTATASAGTAPATPASAEAVAEGAADTSTSGATSAATTTVASSTPPGSASATDGGAPERPGRVSRPMVVAAAFAGALLLGAPFVVAGAQKDEAEPQRREAAAAWKEADQDGGYVPGTDPDSPQGVPAADGDKPGGTPARGEKGPVNHVRADVGDGPAPADAKDGRKPANGSAKAGTKDGKGAEGTGSSTEKGDAVARTPVGTDPTAPAATPSAGTVPKSTTTVVYSGVSGPDCPTQRFQRSAYYSDGDEGWGTHSGGFGGYGCAGKYLSMPMSGSSSKDSDGSATWLFDLPDSARKCSISVHVPGSSNVVRVGGHPSYYTVYDRFLPRTSNLVGSYYVDQQKRRGTWYNVPGTFPVDAKKLSVRLHDRGQDGDNEHHAISALKVTCTG